KPMTVFLDHRGTLWVSTEETLVFLPAGTRVFQRTGIQLGVVRQIAEAPNGGLWVAETTRSVRPVPLDADRPELAETEIQVGSIAILFDREGALWIVTLGDGIRRAPLPDRLKGRVGQFDPAVESYTTGAGLTADYGRAVLEDREGNVWIGTDRGIDRFRRRNLVSTAPLITAHDA